MAENKKKKIKLETLSQQAKNKKDFLIVIGLLISFGIVLISIVSYFFSVQKTKIYKKQQTKVLKNKDLKLIPEADFKENWAISVENALKTQREDLKLFIKKFTEEQNKTRNELKNMIIDAIAQQKTLLIQQKKETDKKIESLKKYTESQIESLKAKIESLKNTQQLTNGVRTDSSNGKANKNNEIVIGEDLLPKLPENALPPKKGTKKEGKETKQNEIDQAIAKITGTLPKSKKNTKQNNQATQQAKQQIPKNQLINRPNLKMVDLDTGNNEQIIEENKKAIIEAEKKEIPKNYYVATGLTSAYLVTGVYAPVFSAGNTEPLPVLLQAEGDVLIANEDTENIDKCFLIGSAKGNMNSQTADIRLVKISCSLKGGKYFIEGPISGWVIGENGIPGVHGTLLYKNGAFISKTFIAGFLQTFSQALTGGQVAPLTGTATTNTTNAVGQNIQYAAAQGASNVFGKIADYYLKMAEQIFPVIEVKPGRTIDVLLKGGDSLTLKKVAKADIFKMEENIEEMEYQQKIGKEQKKLNEQNKYNKNVLEQATKTKK